jgi:hypothetical protein
MTTHDDSSEQLKSQWKNFDFEALKSEPMESQSASLDFLERIPLFAKKAKNINEATKASGKLAYTEGVALSGVPLDVIKATPVIGIALNSLDVIRVPMLYIACLMMGEKVPFTLKNNTKWALGGILLGLGLTGMLFPPVAAFTAIAVPALLLVSSAATFKLLRDQRQNDKMMSLALDQEIPRKEAALAEIITKMSDAPELTALHKEALEQKNQLKALYHQQEKLKSSQDKFTMLDGTVSMTIPALLTVASVLSVLVIPAAPFIAMSAGFLSGGYLVGRIIASKFNLSDINPLSLFKKEGEASYVSRCPASGEALDSHEPSRSVLNNLRAHSDKPLLIKQRLPVAREVTPGEASKVKTILPLADSVRSPRMTI